MRAAALLVALALAGPPVAADDAVGAGVFERHCAICHDAGPSRPGTLRLAWDRGADRALLTARTDLTAAYVKAVVRTGFNQMPQYREVELSTAELDALAAWLARPR